MPATGGLHKAFSKSPSSCDRCCCPQWNTLGTVPFEASNWSFKRKSPFLYCVNALCHCLSLSLSLFFSTNQYLVSTLITNNYKDKGPGPLVFANSLPGSTSRAHRESARFYFLQHRTLQKKNKQKKKNALNPHKSQISERITDKHLQVKRVCLSVIGWLVHDSKWSELVCKYYMTQV